VEQLPLFGESPRDQRGGNDVAARLASEHAEAARLAASIPASVHFGTSSWAFPGWAGLVYSSSAPPSSLAREGLREYAQHPLLRTVGIDRSYYAPIPLEDLRRYADQLPGGFPCCAKAPAAVASPVVPGARGTARTAWNPDFLNADRLTDELLEPFALAFRDHCGPFVVEIAPLPKGVEMDRSSFAERLDRFLGRLPREFEYAVELRDPRLLTPEYARVLSAHAAAHTFNYWSAMPMPADQATRVPVGSAPFTVVRLLLRPGTWYEEQREAFRPFNRLVAPDERMREDVIGIVSRALPHRRVYVLVNNKAEGSAPLTIRALAERLVSQSARP
jgi:uncharacterized protein YecE (DUF72 family)